MKKIIIFVSFIVIAGFRFSIPVSFVHAETNILANISAGALTALTNEERLKNNIPALLKSALLQEAAEMKVKDMITYGYISHNTPDGKPPWYWLDLAGYKYTTAGENIAIDFRYSKDAESAWMNSPGHRENILKREYTQVGTAVGHGIYESRDTVFVVQLFATPQVSLTQSVVVPPKKTFQSSQKKVAIPKKPSVDVKKENNMKQYPTLYYTYDTGLSCVII